MKEEQREECLDELRFEAGVEAYHESVNRKSYCLGAATKHSGLRRGRDTFIRVTESCSPQFTAAILTDVPTDRHEHTCVQRYVD
jgi:hypothetical protein